MSGRLLAGTVAAITPLLVAVTVPLTVLMAAADPAAMTASSSTITATGVPTAYAAMVAAAGRRCSVVTAPLLAAQLEQESGWNPRAVSPVGAQGIAQFMPGTWPEWGHDIDGNGTASPFDPADAIDAQGRYMCSLAAQMQSAVGDGAARGDVVSLTLAAYNAGPGAVLTYGGVPPYTETQGYVTRIKRLTAKYTAASTPTANGPVPAGFDQQGNPRTVNQAIGWELAQMPNGAPGERVLGGCERYVTLAYGHAGGYPTAISHWDAPGPRSVGMSEPPRGALVFWRTSNPAGHVGLYIGNGQVISTDFDGTRYAAGVLGVGSIQNLDKWGQRLGWRAPNFRVNSEG